MMSTDAMAGFAVVELVRCFDRLGLFEALEQPATVERLAEKSGLPVRPLALTLPILSALGYLEQLGETFRRRHVQHGALEELPKLGAFLESGDVGDQIDRQERRGSYYAKSVLGLGSLFAEEASRLAEVLRPAPSIADVGAGSGIWSLSMAARHGGRVIAIDRPEVVPSTAAASEVFGFATKPEIIAGDYFEVELDTPVDRIVMANVLHLETPENAARLVQHYARYLSPDGELVIVDVFSGEGFEDRLAASIYQLHLGMRTAKGRAHPEADLRTWCAAAGLGAQRVVRLGRFGMAALVCTREEAVVKEREMTTVAVEDLRALREAKETYEARFRMIFDGAAEAIMVVDKVGRAIAHTNARFRDLFDVDWMDVELRDLDEVVAPEDRSRFKKLILGLADGTITERRHTLRMLRNGEPFNAELSAFDPHARSVICFIVRDRDRMLRAEKLQALGELVGGLTHDLNTPLGVLKANCALARRSAERLGSDDDPTRALAALDQATRDALRALDKISAKLDAVSRFATLEGSALKALAQHFDSGLALAICQRAADE